MKQIVLLMLSTMALVACDSGDATCSICSHSFTNAECMAIATANGCASGQAYQDTICQPATQGCQFHGCPAAAFMCTATDAGSDAGP